MRKEKKHELRRMIDLFNVITGKIKSTKRTFYIEDLINTSIKVFKLRVEWNILSKDKFSIKFDTSSVSGKIVIKLERHPIFKDSYRIVSSDAELMSKESGLSKDNIKNWGSKLEDYMLTHMNRYIYDYNEK